jgi:multidrug efflux pump subunit AcrA (membrane-fusion protein)
VTDHSFANVTDCSEFHQTLLARPPRIVHGTVLLLVVFLSVALAWTALTQADLVVRAAGRIRPVSAPKKVVSAVRGEVLSASFGGRVVEVHFREGDEVHKGDVLIRLDTERLDNEIAKRRRMIQTGEEERTKLVHLEKILLEQV